MLAGLVSARLDAQPRLRRQLRATSLAQRAQGFGPHAIAPTRDGRFAFLSFNLGETMFKMRLADLGVAAVTDLAAFFPMDCLHIALDPTETTLFAAMRTWQKIAVIDAGTMRVLRTIDGVDPTMGMFTSRHTGRLVAWNGGGTVWFVDPASYEVSTHTDNAMFFSLIAESPSDPTLWYVVFQTSPGHPGGDFGVYRYTTSTLLRTIELPKRDGGNGPTEIVPLPDETKVYVSEFGGWSASYEGFGWVHAVDLVAGHATSVPIDGGALCLELGADARRLYVGAGWPKPDTDLIDVIDTSADEVVDVIPLGRTAYNWPQTQVNDLRLDPVDANVLYATNNDGNAFVRIRLDTETAAGVRVLNREDWRPHLFVHAPGSADGYVLLTESAKVLRFDPSTGHAGTAAQLPGIRADAYQYDMAIEGNGRGLIAQGESFLEVDLEKMAVVTTHRLAQGAPGVWHFTPSGDGTRIYTVTQDRAAPPGNSPQNLFAAFDRSSFQVVVTRHLEGGEFAGRPFELPDGSKLYVLGGWNYPGGAVTVHVLGTDDLAIRTTIVFDQPGLMGISAGPYVPFAFDPASHTLYVGATEVVLGIDTTTDTITRVIPLADVLPAAGLGHGELTYLNAVGLVHDPAHDLLFIAHLDGSFISVYDLAAGHFRPKVIPLRLLPHQGYMPKFLFTSPDLGTIFSINMRSDTISVIDTASLTVKDAIELRDHLGSR